MAGSVHYRVAATRLRNLVGAVTPRFERTSAITEIEPKQASFYATVRTIYDYGRADEGVFYYVMEYLRGITLTQLVRLEGRVSPPRTVFILKQVCASLAEAHDKGLVHRDIKPDNIMLCQRGGLSDFVKVLDFGLARNISPRPEAAITEPGQIGGTPLYMAPERVSQPERVDARSDLYSVGAVAFFMLSGRALWAGRSSWEVLAQVVSESPPRLKDMSGDSIPDALDQLVTSCLARNPKDRPESAHAVIAALDAMRLEATWSQADAHHWWQSHNASSDDNPMAACGTTPSGRPASNQGAV